MENTFQIAKYVMKKYMKKGGSKEAGGNKTLYPSGRVSSMVLYANEMYLKEKGIVLFNGKELDQEMERFFPDDSKVLFSDSEIMEDKVILNENTKLFLDKKFEEYEKLNEKKDRLVPFQGLDKIQ